MFTIDRLGKTAGITITPKDNREFRDIEINTVKKLLAEHGVILFRDFNIDTARYSEFTHSICQKVTLDPAREFVSSNAQLVDSGLDSIPLHCENGLTPFLPDLLLFYCDIPASAGSETTFCDGEVVWNHLSEETKKYFNEHQFYFSRTIPKVLWEKYMFNEFNIKDPSQVTTDFLHRIASMFPQHQLQLLADGSLHANLNIPLVHTSKFSDKPAFANSLIGPSYNYQKPTAMDETSNPIPQAFYDEFQAVSDTLTEEVAWKKNDLLIIDNTRFMHGRRKIVDSNRKIYASMGYL